ARAHGLEGMHLCAHGTSSLCATALCMAGDDVCAAHSPAPDVRASGVAISRGKLVGQAAGRDDWQFHRPAREGRVHAAFEARPPAAGRWVRGRVRGPLCSSARRIICHQVVLRKYD
ncbi:hypothetical protein RZS08_27130, partial [Arthrospira platensis SPKY1]|nr:hypothetical protein [Arthrospira platensis SPKY1]